MAQQGEVKDRKAYRVYILLLLLLLNSLSHADRHLFSILIPSVKAEFGVSDSLLGLIAGPGFIVSYVLFSMPLARLADSWSRRGVLALAATVWSAATAVCGMAANATQLALARFVVGIGEAGGLPPSQSVLASLYGENRRAAAMGLLASATYIGLIIGLLGGAAIAAEWGWRAAFFTLAVPGFPLALLFWITGPRRSAEEGQSAAGKEGPGFWTSVRGFWNIKSLRLIAVGVGTFNIFGYAAAIWTPAFFMRSHGMSVVEAGAWLGIGSAVGGIAGSIASGAIVDRLRRRGEQWQLRVPAIAFLLSFPVNAGTFLVPSGTSVSIGELVVPVVALLGMVGGSMVAFWAGPSFSAAARLVSPSQRAQATAMLVVVINVIGSMVGPTLSGLVSDLLVGRLGPESLRVSLLMMSLLTIIGGMLFWRASNHYPRDLAAREAIQGAIRPA